MNHLIDRKYLDFSYERITPDFLQSRPSAVEVREIAMAVLFVQQRGDNNSTFVMAKKPILIRLVSPIRIRLTLSTSHSESSMRLYLEGCSSHQIHFALLSRETRPESPNIDGWELRNKKESVLTLYKRR